VLEWMRGRVPAVDALPTNPPTVQQQKPLDPYEIMHHHFDFSEHEGLSRWLRISVSVPSAAVGSAAVGSAAGVVGLRSVVVHRTLASTPTAQLPWYSTPIWLSVTRALAYSTAGLLVDTKPLDQSYVTHGMHDMERTHGMQGYSFEPTCVYLAVCTGGFAFCAAVYIYLTWGCVCDASCLDKCPLLGQPCQTTCKCQCQACECPCRCNSSCRSRCSKECVADCKCTCLFCKCKGAESDFKCD
jgi:hypothetical protein